MTDPERCPTCSRPIPKERSDDAPSRSVFAISEPRGEHGQLNDLLSQVNDRLSRHGAELVPAGGKTWKYGTLHYLLYAVATASDDVIRALAPSEEGA